MKKIFTLFFLSGMIFLGACSMKMDDKGVEIKDNAGKVKVDGNGIKTESKQGKININNSGVNINTPGTNVETGQTTVENKNKGQIKQEKNINTEKTVEIDDKNEKEEIFNVIDQILND